MALAGYTIQASTSQAAATTTTSSTFPFDPEDVVTAMVLNGGAPPATGGTVKLQLSADNVNWIDIDLRMSGQEANQAYYHKFEFSDYIGGGMLRSAQQLSRLAGSTSGTTQWLYFRLVFAGNPDQAVTISAVGALATRTFQLDVTGINSTNGGAIGSWTPPMGGPVIINNLVVYCTGSSGGAATLNVGVATNGTTSSATLINAQQLNAANNSIIVSGTGTSATVQGLLTTTQAVTLTGSANSVGFTAKVIITYTIPEG